MQQISRPQTWSTLSCLLAPVQGSAGRQYLIHILSTAVADLGFVPDWKKTAFWCDNSFLQAYCINLIFISPGGWIDVIHSFILQDGCDLFIHSSCSCGSVTL